MRFDVKNNLVILYKFVIKNFTCKACFRLLKIEKIITKKCVKNTQKLTL